MTGPNRWLEGERPRGADYDRRFALLEASGHDVHGEATLVERYGPSSVLDAGCGTGRVAIELHRRGHSVVGVDVDRAMLDAARAKAPRVTWLEADLGDPDLLVGHEFDVVVLAGNVMIFVAPGTEAAVVANMARLTRCGGVVISGYSLVPRGLSCEIHDEMAAAAGLVLEERWATWDKERFVAGGDYAVSVHRKSGPASLG